MRFLNRHTFTFYVFRVTLIINSNIFKLQLSTYTITPMKTLKLDNPLRCSRQNDIFNFGYYSDRTPNKQI